MEVVYHRFPTNGASKSIGASKSLKCGAPEEQVETGGGGTHSGRSGFVYAERPVVRGEGVSTLKNKTMESFKDVFCSV